MNTQLIFKSHPLKTVLIDNKRFFTVTQIGLALDYAHPNTAIAKLYNRNKDEFTETMTMKVKLKATDGRLNTFRVFSLRGAHLIAMFACTPVAKEFRKWVLDLIEKENTVPQSSTLLAPHRECLPKMVYHTRSKYNPYRAYVTEKGKAVYVGCYPTVDDAVAAQENYFSRGEVKRIQKPRSDIREAEKEMFTNNLRALCHHFRSIDKIWRSQLRPALTLAESKLVSKLYDRFNDSMCILPTIEDLVGRYVPPKR